MRWYRYHQRVVGILALFALAFQLAASFAHVHLDGLRLPFDVSASSASSSDRSPTKAPDQPGAPHQECAICIAIGLLSNALNGGPPAVSLPDLIHFAPLPAVIESKFSVVRFHSFWTRAPPVA
jgi:hypothetical protein